MKVFMDIVSERRRELLILWGVFVLLVFSQYVFSYRHDDPYSFATAWAYITGFIRYMIAPWLVTILLIVSAYVVGRVALLRFLTRGIRFRTQLEESIYSISIGLGLLAILTFVLGLAHLLYPFVFGLIGLVILTAGFRHVVHLFETIRRSFRPLEWDLLETTLLFILGAFVLSTIFRPNNPSIGWDAMNSHLVAPKYYLREHAVTFFNWIKFNSFPQLQEMLLTLEMMFFRDPGSSLIYSFMLGSATLTYMLGTRYFNRKTGLAAAVIFLLIPEVFRDSQAAYVEHVLIFYSLLTVHAFLRWYEMRTVRWLVMLGVVAGLSCGVKYLGATITLIVLALVVIAHFIPIPQWETDLIKENDVSPDDEPEEEAPAKKKRNKKNKRSKGVANKRSELSNNATPDSGNNTSGEGNENHNTEENGNNNNSKASMIFTSLGIALLWTVIIASPWYLRNIVLFGNPFFPFFESIFGALNLGTMNAMRGELSIDHAEMLKYFRFELSPYNLAALPWNTTFHHDHPSYYYAPSTVGPFLLALTPAAFFVRRWRRAGLMLIIFMVLYYSYWFLLERIEYQRYLMSVFPVHALIAAWGVCDLFRVEAFDKRNRTHIAWLLVVVALSTMFFVKVSTKGAFTGRTLYFASEEARRERLSKTFAGWEIIEAINEHIRMGSRLFNEDTRVYGLATENRRFYLNCPLVGDLWTYANHFEFMEHADTGEELYEWLRSYDCEYILYSEGGANSMGYILDIELPSDESFEERFELLAQWYNYYLYRLIAPGETRAGPIAGGPAEGEEEQPEPEEGDEILEAPQ